jgi:hypothetical protein
MHGNFVRSTRARDAIVDYGLRRKLHVSAYYPLTCFDDRRTLRIVVRRKKPMHAPLFTCDLGKFVTEEYSMQPGPPCSRPGGNV